MKVLLGNPPWRVGEFRGVRAGSRWPFLKNYTPQPGVQDYMPFPFFMAYAAAMLERAGFEVSIIDAIAENIDDATYLRRVADFAPDIYMAETGTPCFEVDIASARKVREILPNATVALAGPHVSGMGSWILEKYTCVDAVLRGEYERTLLELATAKYDNGSVSAIRGAIVRERDGRISDGGERGIIENLDDLPWPARHLLPMSKYNDSFCDLPVPNLSMWASRGCPFECVFCLWPQVMYGGTRYRARDPGDVAEEMLRESAKYGMKSVYFDDDTFDIGKSRMLKLAAEIKNRSIGLPWAIMARADTIDAESLEAMRGAGLYAVKYGVESSDESILANSGKRLDLKKLEETVRITKALGIKIHLTFSFGLPGETWDTAKATVEYALELDPDSAQFSIVTPFPGTKHYSWAKDRGYLLTEDWSMYNGLGRAVARTEAMTGVDLEDALAYALEQWRAHDASRRLFTGARGKRYYYFSQALKNPVKALRYAKLSVDQYLRGMARRVKR